MTRQAFLLAVPEAILAQPLASHTTQPDRTRPKLLIVVAHPDDEYAFAATTYRLTHELGWDADHVVITNGEGGYRYSALAESYYGVALTDEAEGRRHLPSIRKRETRAAGKVLGIRRHYFLDQRDSGFATDAASAPSTNWDNDAVLSFLTRLLQREQYDAVFTLLPTAETHGHHRAATLLALQAAVSLPADRRPLLLAGDPRSDNTPAERYRRAPGQALFQTRGEDPAFVMDRGARFGYRDTLDYQIVVNWFIAEHKSQGLFQTDSGKHRLEQFWVFEASGHDADARVRKLASQLTPAARVAAAW